MIEILAIHHAVNTTREEAQSLLDCSLELNNGKLCCSCGCLLYMGDNRYVFSCSRFTASIRLASAKRMLLMFDSQPITIATIRKYQ